MKKKRSESTTSSTPAPETPPAANPTKGKRSIPPHGLPPEDIIPASKAARLARIGLSGLWRWVLTGKLRGWKRGGRLFVSKADILATFQEITGVGEAEYRRRSRSPDAPPPPMTARERMTGHELAMAQLRADGIA